MKIFVMLEKIRVSGNITQFCVSIHKSKKAVETRFDRMGNPYKMKVFDI